MNPLKIITDFFKKFSKAYKDSQIWTDIETFEQLQEALKYSHDKPIGILVRSTMHFRSDYMMENFERQARAMDLSPVKFYSLNYTGNSELKEQFQKFLGIEVLPATFFIFRNGKAIFKRHEEIIDMKKLIKALENYKEDA